MRIKIYDKRLQDKPERRLTSTPVFFTKQECLFVFIVNWETQQEMKYNLFVKYFSIKPSYTIDGEKLYAVGFTGKRGAKISDYDVKYLYFTK